MKKQYERDEMDDLGVETISISSIDPVGDGEAKEANPYLELQLKMATSSINHEYARMEYEETETENHERREELLDYMQNCRHEYFEARDALSNYDPYALAEFEQDLLTQKQQALRHYTA